MTRAPRSSRRFRRSAACVAARVITIVLPVSAILGDLGENFSGSHRKKFLTEVESQLGGVVNRTAHFFSDHACAIKTGNEASDDELRSFYTGLSRDGNLAAAA